MKIFLIGLPGSGKTTLGVDLAKALDIPFVDLDKEIEKAEGKTIREIFEEKKESYFREIESSHLKKWCSSPGPFVMATGGGAPVYFDNLEIINRSGTSFFLDVPPREIARRIGSLSVSKRPLLAGATPDMLKDQIEFMRSNRINQYLKANHTLAGDAIKVSELLAKIRKEDQV